MHWNRKLRTESGGAIRLVLDAAREAERVLEAESRLHPTYADIRHRRGLLHLARGEHEAARREFEDALGIHPGYRAAHYGLRLAQILGGETLPDEPQSGGAFADETLWRCVDRAYRHRAAAGDPVAELREAADEDSPFFHHYAAFFALEAGDAAAVQRHLEAAAECSRISRQSFERAGLLPWSEESGAKASALLGPLLWSPLAADLHAYLGKIYATNQLWEEARDCFERAYWVYPRAAVYALHCAEVAIARGEERQALTLLREAIEADGSFVEARIALGFEYASQGFAEEALAEFEEAARLAPGYADVRYNLGLLYVATDRREEALEQFGQALNLNRSYLPARQGLATLLCRMGRYEDGLREYQRILRHGFQSADMLAQMGRAALALERTDEALQYLERARHLNPDFLLTHYYLGQAYRRKGLRNKARSAWRHYLKSAGDWPPQEVQAGGEEMPEAESA